MANVTTQATAPAAAQRPGSARAAVPNAACPKPRLPARRMRRLAVVVEWYDLVVEAFRIGPGQLVQVICGRRHRRDLSAEWARTPGARRLVEWLHELLAQLRIAVVAVLAQVNVTGLAAER